MVLFESEFVSSATAIGTSVLWSSSLLVAVLSLAVGRRSYQSYRPCVTAVEASSVACPNRVGGHLLPSSAQCGRLISGTFSEPMRLARFAREELSDKLDKLVSSIFFGKLKSINVSVGSQIRGGFQQTFFGKKSFKSEKK